MYINVECSFGTNTHCVLIRLNRTASNTMVVDIHCQLYWIKNQLGDTPMGVSGRYSRMLN